MRFKGFRGLAFRVAGGFGDLPVNTYNRALMGFCLE